MIYSSCQDVIEWVFKEIGELANLEKQKFTWSGKSPNEIDSYSEMIARIFDDLEIDSAIEYLKRKKCIDENLISEVQILVVRLENFIPKATELEGDGSGYYLILEHHEWIEITKMAEKLLLKTKSPN